MALACITHRLAGKYNDLKFKPEITWLIRNRRFLRRRLCRICPTGLFLSQIIHHAKFRDEPDLYHEEPEIHTFRTPKYLGYPASFNFAPLIPKLRNHMPKSTHSNIIGLCLGITAWLTSSRRNRSLGKLRRGDLDGGIALL